MASRIQLSRRRGWRKPPGAIVVSRPTRWGNPFLIGADGVPNRERAVADFRAALIEGRLGFTIADARLYLAGQDLACWCPLDRPCHADVLLELTAADLP